MKTHRIALLGLTVLVGIGVSARPSEAQERKYPKRVYTTAHCGDRLPVLDGVPDDVCWQRVEWAGDFLQWQPAEGEPPSQDTLFKILYDEDALYFAARAYDTEPHRIDDILSRRDRFPGDWVEINIDSYHDFRTAFSFTSSVSGTRGDEFISNDGNNWDGSWDPVWELATNIDDEGWTLEARIPLSQLRFADKDEHVWGIQVQRRIYREEERSMWQPKDRNENGWVSRFGELRGIQGIRAPRRVELLPYGLSKGERFEEVDGDPFRDGSAGTVSLGLDGKVGVTSDLTLDFTINPDFGQVEADPSEVNLTAFETFFSERRPFFIEGRNIFNFQIAPSAAGGSFTRDNLFYSRRIGGRPQFSPDANDGEFVQSVDNTSILGALKVSGKTGSGLSVGILESVTAREKAAIQGAGPERKQTVEPLTNFFVGRVQQDLDEGNTRFGGMFTAVNRDIKDPALDFLHRSAYTGGADFFRFWRDKTWYFALNGAFSHVRGDEQAILDTQTSSRRYYQRPDNDYARLDPSRTSLTGHAGSARLSKSGGGNFRFETGGAWRSPGFEVNDAGFMRRADEINQFSWAGYHINKPFSAFRALRFNVNQWLEWDFGQTLLSRDFNGNFNANLKNNWNFGGGVNRELENVSNTQLRGGPSSKWPGNWNGWFWVNSDSRKRVDYGFGGDWVNGDEDSRRFRSVWTYVNFRPTNAVRLSFDPSFSWNDPEMQYIDTVSFDDESRYLFGSLEQRTLNLTLRLDYSVTPNLTVQYYGSPFISSGKYRDFKRITDPQAEAYRQRFAEFADSEAMLDAADGEYDVDEDGDGTTDYAFDDPDFNFKEFNSNLVVRWEFQAGSTLFLVWSQARVGFDPTGEFSLRNDLDDLFAVHPHNVFLLKINKWFSL